MTIRFSAESIAANAPSATSGIVGGDGVRVAFRAGASSNSSAVDAALWFADAFNRQRRAALLDRLVVLSLDADGLDWNAVADARDAWGVHPARR
jgi:hypothetical protein